MGKTRNSKLNKISERKSWEQKLVLSDRVFNHAIDMLCIAGFDGYFKTLNPSWSKTLGWSNEELLSRPWIDFVHPDDRDATQNVKAILINGEEVFQFENRYLCKDGSYKWISWNSYPYSTENIMFGVARDVTYKKIAEEKILNSELKLKEQVEEFVALNEELTQANEELRRLTEDLSESNQRNTALLAANPDLMFVYSRDGVFLDFHTQSNQALFLNPQEFLNKKATEVLPKFLADLNQSAIDKLFETDEPQSFSYTIEIGGEMHYFDARLVKYGKNKALAIIRDITEKRKSEELIRQLASMVDLAPSAINVHDFKGNPIYTNQRNLDLHGYSRDEWMSLSLTQIDLPISKELFGSRVEQIKEKGEAFFEVEHYRKDGSILPMEIYAKFVDWAGKPVMLSIGTDIVERRRAEKTLRESEERFRNMFEIHNAVMLLIEPDTGRIFQANNAAVEFYGYTREKLCSMTIQDINQLPAKEIEKLRKLALKQNKNYFIFHHKLANGEIRTVEVHSSPIDADGKKYLFSIMHDITERNIFENKLKERDAQLSLALEVAKIGYWKINLGNNSVEWFAGHEKLFGIPLEEFKGTLDAVQEMVHPDDRERGVHNLNRALTENVPFDNTYRVIHPNGRTRWLHSYGNLFRDNEGNPQYIFGISQDITKIKEEEFAIRDSEEKYRLLFEANKDGIAIFETDNNTIPIHFTDANSSMAEMLGYSRDEFVKLNPNQFEQGIGQSDIERRISEMHNYGYSEFETKLKHKSGKIIDASIKSVLIYYGGKTLVYNIVRDISERKKAEGEMRKTLELLNETQSLAHLGSWVFDIEFNKLIWSDEVYRIFGFTPNEFDASYSLFVDRVHPEDRDRVNSVYTDSIKNNQSEYEIEHRIIRHDTGEIRYVLEKCYHERNESGKIVRSIGMVHDITERKKYSDAIKESEERVKSVLRVAPVGIVIVKDRISQDLNEAVSAITGFSMAELKGRTARLLYDNDIEFNRVGDLVYSELRRSGVTNVEIQWRHKNGNLIDIQLTGTPIVSGNLSEGVVFVVQDITERKLTEKLTNARVKMLELSRSCSVEELLGETLNQVENITGSKIGFYHFIDEDRGTVELQKWSDRTLQEFCWVQEPFEKHYPIAKAGVWVDCVRYRKPIIHNNYDALPNKHGLPKGHAAIVRELVVPVIRNNKIVSILGVGNKDVDYSSLDVDIIAKLADTVWDIIDRKIADEALKKSEAQFRLLFNNMTQGFALHEVIQNEKGEVIDYKYLDVNPAFESLTGLKRDYVLGKAVLEILPDTEKFWIDIYGKVALKGEEVKFENYSREIGKYFEVNAFSPKKGQFAVIFTDVTQRRQADEKIKLLSKGLEQSPAIVVITDSKGNIEYVNPTFSRITGYSLQEVIGKNPRILKSGNQDEEFYKNLWATIIRGEDWSGEMLNKKKNGVYYWESALISPIKDEDGQILHFIAIKEDITDRKKGEKALMQSETMLKEKNEELTIAWRKAEESDRLKTAFLANMSHEIRTPMNAIIGFSEILLRPNLSQEKYAFFGNIINEACMQLLSVVNDVIDISKIETNQISIFEDNININETIKRVANIFSRSAEKKKNTILFDLALPDEFAFIRTDETKFSQIINNLISNAIKFTENGEITLGYKIANNRIDCFVKDTGIGISKENHHVIFERFRQVETSDSRKYGGTGLGLSISKAFVELMGGDIWVESELGKGSEFHFSLPLKTIQSISDKKNQSKTETYDFSGRTILIAEDEPANFVLLQSWFEEDNVNILHASDGAEAIELLKLNADVDLILMDIKMPVLNGIEATKLIRKFNTNIPIVALTAYALAGDKDRCIAAGCNSYLPKPLKRNDLMGIVGKFIGLRSK